MTSTHVLLIGQSSTPTVLLEGSSCNSNILISVINSMLLISVLVCSALTVCIQKEKLSDCKQHAIEKATTDIVASSISEHHIEESILRGEIIKS